MVTLEVITVLLMLGPQQKRHTREQALVFHQCRRRLLRVAADLTCIHSLYVYSFISEDARDQHSTGGDAG